MAVYDGEVHNHTSVSVGRTPDGRYRVQVRFLADDKTTVVAEEYMDHPVWMLDLANKLTIATQHVIGGW